MSKKGKLEKQSAIIEIVSIILLSLLSPPSVLENFGSTKEREGEGRKRVKEGGDGTTTCQSAVRVRDPPTKSSRGSGSVNAYMHAYVVESERRSSDIGKQLTR